jgi:hypothetical protein
MSNPPCRPRCVSSRGISWTVISRDQLTVIFGRRTIAARCVIWSCMIVASPTWRGNTFSSSSTQSIGGSVRASTDSRASRAASRSATYSLVTFGWRSAALRGPRGTRREVRPDDLGDQRTRPAWRCPGRSRRKACSTTRERDCWPSRFSSPAEALGNDALETDLYLPRDQLTGADEPVPA